MKINGLLCVVLGLAMVMFAPVQNAFGFTWINYGDTNLGNPESVSGLTVGNSSVGAAESASQAIQISGAGTVLPTGYSFFDVFFHFDGSSWDAYNNIPSTGGYYDVFAAVLSTDGYYWDLSNTGIHPLENNPALVLGYDLVHPGPNDSYWGGESDSDNLLATSHEDVRFGFNTDPTKQYYLTIFMQTRQDQYMPSWATFSNIQVGTGVVPEPATLGLLGLGLLGLFRKRLIAHS